MDCVRVVGVVFEVWCWIMSCMPGVVLLGLGMGESCGCQCGRDARW